MSVSMRRDLLEPCSYRFVGAVLVGAFAANAATAGVLYTIGPDSSFLPRSFTAFGGGDEASVFNLGDGLLVCNGGPAYRATDGRFYAVANDGSGNSVLESFTPAGAGTLTLNMSLGMVFLSGLAFDSSDGDHYAVADDPVSGDSSLDRISLGPSSVTPVVDLGIGFEGGGLFTGGLKFDPADGLFEVLSSDGSGVSRAFSSIALNGTVTPLFNLGDGSISFNGGLLFDPSGGQFYAISNDGLENSTLDTFTLGGAGAFTPLFSIGQGFNNVGLAETPRPPSLPVWCLWCSGCWPVH
jgi:hypothetical protein